MKPFHEFMAWVVVMGVVGCGAKPTPAPQAKADPTTEKAPAQVAEGAGGRSTSTAETAPAKQVEQPKGAEITEGEKAGQIRIDDVLKMAFVWCPPGEFRMGSPKSEKSRQDDENEVDVTLSKGFWLGRTEVTQGQWKSVADSEPWKGRGSVKEGANVAATHVEWGDVAKFLAKLTQRERSADRLPAGWEYRLPTEAEWEYACRAGSTTAYAFGDDAAQLGEYGWFGIKDSSADAHAHEVGTLKSNAWGLFDMHGNVCEWCADWYEAKLPGGSDPTGPPQGKDRVFRGGGWTFPDWFCRSAHRNHGSLAARDFNLGFRVALAPMRQAKAK